MTAKKPAADAALAEELLVQVARQARRVPLPVFAVALTTAFMAAGAAPAWALATWLGFVGVVVVARRIVLAALPARTDVALETRLGIAVALSVASGVVHGSGVAFFAVMDDYQRVVQTLLLMALCTGAVATTLGQRPMLVGFVVPALAPLCLAWPLAAGSDAAHWTAAAVAVFIAAFALILIAMGGDNYRTFAESFEMRRQHAAMNERLVEALAQAESASRAKTRFLASASHDLRQPMHTLALFAEALWLRPLDEASRELAAHMRTALTVLSSQLDALLDVSKLDAQIVQPRPQALDLNVMLQRLHRQSLPAAERRGLAMHLRSQAGHWCRTDPMLLERVVRNLIDNALKYTQEGVVLLVLERAGDVHRIRVADTGCGIPAAELPRVFEEFYQVDNAERDRTQGLGLGLSIVSRLCQLLGVRIDIDSEVGRGTTVTLEVAAAAPRAEAFDAMPRPETVSGLDVLVIDDEEAARVGMKTLLEALECRVVAVASAADACRAAAALRPDIVLADLRLRGDDGITAIARLRERCGALPALLLSGDTAPERLRQAQEAGLRMLHKPVALPQLLQAMHEALDTGEGERERGAAAVG